MTKDYSKDIFFQPFGDGSQLLFTFFATEDICKMSSRKEQKRYYSAMSPLELYK